MQKVIFIFLISMTTTQLQAQSNKKRKYPAVTVSVEINSPLSLQESFEYIVPMDLEHIFEPYKMIPGVKGTSNKEAWYKPGMQRTVYFDDGSSSQEYLLSVTPYSGFTYKVNGFTSSLKMLIEQINGSWTFSETASGALQIEWTYEFVPKNFIARSLVNMIVARQIKTPMQHAMDIMKEELESGKLYPYRRRVGNW